MISSAVGMWSIDQCSSGRGGYMSFCHCGGSSSSVSWRFRCKLSCWIFGSGLLKFCMVGALGCCCCGVTGGLSCLLACGRTMGVLPCSLSCCELLELTLMVIPSRRGRCRLVAFIRHGLMYVLKMMMMMQQASSMMRVSCVVWVFACGTRPCA